MRVILAGPVPPPHGGVSVHIERLRNRLLECGIDVDIRDEQQSGESFGAFVRRAGFVDLDELEGIFHCHIHNPWTLGIAGVRARIGGAMIVTVHTLNSRLLRENGFFRRIVLKRLLRGSTGLLSAKR